MPFELRPYPAATLEPSGAYLQMAWKQRVYPLAERMGVDIRLPDVSPQPYTRLAFHGLEFAKDHRKGDEYNSAVMSAFFQRSENIGDPEVLSNIAASVGLDWNAFREALDSPVYRSRVEQLLKHAHKEVRVEGVPLFLIGSTRLSGVQPQEVIERAIDFELQGTQPRA